MNRLFTPLLDHTKITNFSYLKFNKNGTVLNLTTEEKWIQFRFEEKIKYKILFQDHLAEAKYNVPYLYLWPKNTIDPLLGALHQYNIWNGCNIYISNANFIEVFSFASSVENEKIQNFYINNFDLLKTFIIYFKENIGEMSGINLKSNLIQTGLTLPASNVSQNNPDLAQNSFYNRTKFKRIHISENLYLTRKEFECCAHLLRGNNIKDIAKIINLSPRTIETHLNNIKLKSNCSTRSELLELISNDRWIFDAILNANK